MAIELSALTAFYDRAMEGDGLYAVAYALLKHVQVLDVLASNVSDMDAGFDNVADAVRDVASHVEDLVAAGEAGDAG